MGISKKKDQTPQKGSLKKKGSKQKEFKRNPLKKEFKKGFKTRNPLKKRGFKRESLKEKGFFIKLPKKQRI